jgi:hypothetical protein
MNKIFKLFLLFSLALVASISHAEGGCPPGQYPQQGQGWQTCVPIPGADNAQQPAQPTVQWYPRSGAIVADGKKGVLGTSENERNPSDAVRKAMASCQAKGGDDCKVRDSYSNGCAVMTVGAKGFAVDGGDTIKQATSNSLAKCSADGDTECHVYYSGCSLPSREG